MSAETLPAPTTTSPGKQEMRSTWDNVPSGINKKSSNEKGDDNIIYDITDGKAPAASATPIADWGSAW